MAAPTIDFDARYSDAIIDDAAKFFVRRQFRKYGWILILACVINVFGFVTVVLLGVRGWMAVAVGIIAVAGPLYFPWAYNRMPRALAGPIKQVLKPTAHVSVSPTAFVLSANGRSFTKQWSDLPEIVETPAYFLLVVARSAFTFVPKEGAPEGAIQMIREVAIANERAA